MIDHPNIKGVRRSVEIDNNADWKTIVEVVTDLELDIASPACDEAAVDSLVEAAVQWGASHQTTWDKLRIVSA